MRLLTLWGIDRFREDESGPGRCREIRRRLVRSTYRRFGPGAAWVQRHVAQCPRCQRRLAALGKVDLALSTIRSQPHRLDLVRRANSAAVRMLSHDLREHARSRRLEQAQPESGLMEYCARHQNVITGLAACLAIVILTKAGIFSSFNKVNTYGPSALKQYYADRAGEDLANEVFKG